MAEKSIKRVNQYKQMKIIFFTIICVCHTFVSALPTEEPALQEYFTKFEEEISASRALGKEGLDDLGQSLQYLGRGVRSSPDPRVQRCYYQAQDAIISIPGHARYFTDQLEDMRADKETIYEYYQARGWYFHNTFPHIPSPEMIQVLGHYLDDFRDSNSPNLPLEKRTVMNDASNSNERNRKTPNAWYASYVLSNIGLRNFPADTEMASPLSKGSLENWKNARAWYQEVKAGQRTFSFKGKSVEYRFNPDGTWDTIPIKNPPQDAIIYPTAEVIQALATRKMLEQAQKEAEHAAEQKKIRQAQLMKFGWWLAGIAPIILLGLLWWRKKRDNL